MDLNVYSCADGRLLLVPGCFVPSLRAQHRYGPLRLVGVVAVDESPPWKSVLQEIDLRAYARIDDSVIVKELLTRADPLHTPDVVAPVLASASVSTSPCGDNGV